MYTSAGLGGYVAEKAEEETGWLFPVGDEIHELGYVHMFTDMFDAMDAGREPKETFYDGYIVNAIMDACYRSVKSKRWEPIDLEVWRGTIITEAEGIEVDYDEKSTLIKKEKMPDGRTKLILKDKETGKIIQKITE
jgi:hypothetical protein